jgi:hypothetical protein
MSESLYRLFKLIVMSLFLIGVFIIGWRFTENGRYVQLDARKMWIPVGDKLHAPTQGGTYVIDTRDGEVYGMFAHDEKLINRGK